MSKPKKILVIRNDKLGDFMLAWPALSLLKKQYPESTITILIPSYTKPMAEICPWIDSIIIDDVHSTALKDALHLSKKIKTLNFDVSISLFSELRTALALWLARVPERLGPATKIAQLFLNLRLKQKRSLSLKPEYEYNTDLVRHFISLQGDRPLDSQEPPYLKFNQQEIIDLRQAYMDEHNIDNGYKLVFIHAGSGGSAINLSLQQFADLAIHLNKSTRLHFILTAGPDELDIASRLSELMHGTSHNIYHSTEGLINFSRLISICDLFISGSTGPLHIAGALNVCTVAFYPARRSATPLRWQTLNSEEKRIYFTPDSYQGEGDMSRIDVIECARKISKKYF
ncbi:MAG: glycosyltransferase family 9 protein [Gammaproteobacteria bacterium]|nr:glycosyltransferase family 9 protein [Gammaproteobacteria bacterium]